MEAAANDAWVMTGGAETQDRRYVAYYRVSTRQQGRSGLGLEAQRASISSFLKGVSGTLFAEFTEVESGTKNDRPQFNEALRICRIYDATLVIAKLDRLARNVAVTSKLMEGGIEFVAADFPQANRLTIHILAAIAEYEAKLISERVRAAIAAARARGVIWKGGYKNSPIGHLDAARIKANVGRVKRATERAVDLLPIVQPLRERGYSLFQIANELTRLRIKTPRGGVSWWPSSVRRVFILGAIALPSSKRRYNRSTRRFERYD